jgi:hypothetical protein
MSHVVELVGPTFTSKWSVVTVKASAAVAVLTGATRTARVSPAAANRPKGRDMRMEAPSPTHAGYNHTPMTSQRPRSGQVTAVVERK